MSSLNQDGRSAPARAHIDAIVSERMGDTSRRRFLQIMGASMALATAAGCTWETEEIVPFQRRPDGRVPGKSRRFATTLECAGVASALLVTSYDGRPIKIEGNPEHPLDQGAGSARTQAALLDLYDPDHSCGLVQVDERVAYPRTWKEFDPHWAGLMASRRANGGAGLVFLAEPSSSLTLASLRDRLLAAFPRARWVEWEPVARTQAMAGASLAFGRVVRTQLRIRAARTLVCLDADLLGDHPAALANAREFASRRRPGAEMSRVWAVESTPSITGATADHRLALRAEQLLPFVVALEQRVQARLGIALDPVLKSNAPALASGFLAAEHVERFLANLAAELVERRGDALLETGPRQPAIVHALVHRLNAALGSVGRTLVYTEEPDAARPDPAIAITRLVREMESGAVECLVILGGNPVYDAPVDVDFFRALQRVPTSIHLSHYRDETSRACTWHLPRAHALEAWGDARSWDGTLCTTQPLIDPIHERRTPLEFVAASIGAKETARELVRAAVAPSATDAQWKRNLHDGFVKDSAFASVTPAIARFEVPAIEPRRMQADVPNGQLELVFTADARVFDGRSANNSWLQEVPDAITKMTWGNAATFAPATAKALGIEDATIVKLRLGARELEVAATVLAGQAPGSVTLSLGYGRTAAGLVGGQIADDVAPIGFDAYRLRSANALDSATGLTVEPTGRSYPLARTTDPEVTDEIGRRSREERLTELLREVDVRHVGETETESKSEHAAERTSLWAAPHADAEGARWGMSIDLNACIGCNACTIACQSENNIPVVGREQVMRGREMHWIRIDRYITGPDDAPKVRFQPMACQQCENAPCEQVCPVAATMHSAEGLNDMVYNRCIGTRYCANNCPFKVRRFNYFNYHKQVEKDGAEIQRMLYNPEVTIRHRGVMEKCTFCVQRIQGAKIQAKNAGRALTDGEITPACAQTCPTTAIVFGDLADPQSRVARLRADERGYTMLDELNIHPRTTYMSKVVNPRPEMDQHAG